MPELTLHLNIMDHVYINLLRQANVSMYIAGQNTLMNEVV